MGHQDLEYKDLSKAKDMVSSEPPEPKENKSRWKKIVIITLIVLLCLVGAAVGGFYILRAVGKSNLKKNATSEAPDLHLYEGAQSENGIIHHNGKKYKYNDSIITILCMGIDSDKTIMDTEYKNSGLCDSVFLTVLDVKNKKMSLVAISRDTLTELDIPYSDGTVNYSKEGVLARQYSYGDGKELSGKLTVKTVSELFYNLPIHAYAAIHLDGVGIVNDAVGGVTVKVPTDDPDYIKASGYSPGQTVTLHGDKATQYVRNRSIYTEFSNELRMTRQKEYLINFVKALATKTKSEITAPVNIYKKASPYLNTDISIDKITYIASMITSFNFNEGSIHRVKGENVKVGDYANFIIDESALYDLIINVFYEEVSDSGFVEVTEATTKVTGTTQGAFPAN